METGAYDDMRPALAAVTVRRAGSGVRVAFRVSEPSRVTARFVRRGRTVRTIGVRAAGRAAITARTGLRPGRYRIDLRAEDAAGNRSRVRRLRVTVR